MDEKQMKEKMKKKIDRWNIITLFNILLLIAIILSILYGVISTIIGLYIILLSSLIILISFAIVFIYITTFIKERYDIFIKEDQQNLNLKEKILNIFKFIWFISPAFIIISINLIIIFPTIGTIIGITFSILWLLGPFILSKDENSNKHKQS